MPGFLEVSQSIVGNVEKVIIGKRPQIAVALAAILARGHILIEDVPGVAKTMLARSLATTFGAGYKRVQCTPDLLPTDVTGVSVFNQKSLEFEFLKGPIFTNILLADEINRATPRTQSALLEAMEERQVTVDGMTWPLAPPFIVMATQNPIEQEGTFPLPEAQLDRFLVRISMGYPGMTEESEMLDRLHAGHPLASLKPVVSAQTLVQMQQVAGAVFVHPLVKEYLLKIVHATRENLKLGLGGSPRASIALYRMAQAIAAIEGRNFVIPDDIKRLAVPVLGHRMIIKPEYRLRRETPQLILDEILRQIEAPSSVTSFRDAKSSGKTGELTPEPSAPGVG